VAKPPAPTGAAPENDVFVREVDEEYRRDELSKFARTWGRWILLALGLALAAFGGFLFWQNQERKKAEAATEQLFQALAAIEDGNSAAADAPLATVAASGTAGQRALAALTQAGLAATRGEPDKAVGLLNGVAADAAVAEPLRDLARIKALRLQYESLKPDEVIARAKPYLDGDSPWFPAVAELAGIAHIRAGRTKEAGQLFLRLAGTPEAPETQRARAEQMAAALGEDTSGLAEKLRAAGALGEAAGGEAAGAAPPAPGGAG
jgi:hypothetical protein